MFADPVRDRVYFSHAAWGSIVVWNTSSNALLANVSVGPSPRRMDLSWNGDELFVAINSALAVVDLSSLTLARTIPLSGNPVDVAAGRPGRAFVTTTEYWGYPRIVDTEAGTELGSITAGGTIYQGALARTNLDRSILFIAETGLSPASVRAFDVTTDAVGMVGEAPFGTVGDNLGDLAVSPIEPWLFIASGWPYHVQVVDYLTWSAVRGLSTGPYPNSVGLAQRGGIALASHLFSDVLAFNTTDGSILGTLDFTQDVVSVRASHDGTQAYAITVDLYGGNRRVEHVATGIPPVKESLIAFGFVEPAYGYAPATFTFLGGATYGRPPYTYRWDFGDGETNSSWRATNVYSELGSHAATLTVGDAAGDVSTHDFSVFVLRRPLANPLSVGPMFHGIGFSFFENPAVPADPQVAAGPDHIMEMVNVRYAIWTRDGTLIENKPLGDFFGRDLTTYLADPKILYDAPTRRWFASVLNVEDSATHLAVSKGSDPTAGWYLNSIPANGCPDQPILGVGPVSVIVSVNLFTSCIGEGSYVGAQYWVINKTDALAGRPLRMTSFGPFPDLASLHPVHVIGDAGPMYLASVGWWATQPTDRLSLYAIRGSPPDLEPPVVMNLPVRTVDQPPNAPQRGSQFLVNTGDSRVLDAIVQDGSLWAAFGVACYPVGRLVNQSCIRVVQVDLATHSVVQDLDFGDPVRAYYYPAFRLDGAGNLILVFGVSSTDEYPGVAIATQLAGDERGTVRAPVLLQPGSGPEALWCPTDSCRYGDYFGAANDPLNPQAVWVVGEYGGASGWRTIVASVGLFETVTIAARAVGVSEAMPETPHFTYFSRGQRYSVPLTPEGETFAVDLGTRWEVTGLIEGVPDERWILDGPASGTAVGPEDLELSYVHQYYIALAHAPAAGGNIAPASGWFEAGTTLHLSATPAEGWRFAGWTGTGEGAYSGTAAERDIQVSGPFAESASFEPGLRLDAAGGGTIAYHYANLSGVVAAGTSMTIFVPPGTTVDLVAQPDLFHKFAGWTGESTGTGPYTTVTVSMPASVGATFSVDLSVLGVGGGIPLAAGAVAAGAVVAWVWTRRRRRRRNAHRETVGPRSSTPSDPGEDTSQVGPRGPPPT